MLEYLVAQLLKLIPIIDKVSNEKRDFKDKAIDALSKAISETDFYIQRSLNKDKRDENRERELVELWRKAAIPLRHFDEELSEICKYKSDYWVNPEVWKPSLANNKSISLKSVKEKYANKFN